MKGKDQLNRGEAEQKDVQSSKQNHQPHLDAQVVSLRLLV